MLSFRTMLCTIDLKFTKICNQFEQTHVQTEQLLLRTYQRLKLKTLSKHLRDVTSATIPI